MCSVIIIFRQRDRAAAKQARDKDKGSREVDGGCGLCDVIRLRLYVVCVCQGNRRVGLTSRAGEIQEQARARGVGGVRISHSSADNRENSSSTALRGWRRVCVLAPQNVPLSPLSSRPDESRQRPSITKQPFGSIYRQIKPFLRVSPSRITPSFAITRASAAARSACAAARARAPTPARRRAPPHRAP